ncbi:unnamed protein product [Brassica rapa subsp. trilocularis]
MIFFYCDSRNLQGAICSGRESQERKCHEMRTSTKMSMTKNIFTKPEVEVNNIS